MCLKHVYHPRGFLVGGCQHLWRATQWAALKYLSYPFREKGRENPWPTKVQRIHTHSTPREISQSPLSESTGSLVLCHCSLYSIPGRDRLYKDTQMSPSWNVHLYHSISEDFLLYLLKENGRLCLLADVTWSYLVMVLQYAQTRNHHVAYLKRTLCVTYTSGLFSKL